MSAKTASLLRVSLGLFLLGACAVAAYGQSQTGSISGTITDVNGAAVAGAAVAARQAAIDLAIDTVTSESGLYVFPNVPVGLWTISVEKSGFKRP
jgi:hypothetical protein